MDGMKFGIEAEYALIRPNGRFADFTNTRHDEVRPLLEPLPDFAHPELRVGDAGIRVKNWYVEGDERFDEAGRSTGLALKGLEIRTPVCVAIDECMKSLAELRSMLRAELERSGWSLAAIGFNPCTAAYEPVYSPWETQFHASHVENALPEISTLSFGPDFNFSRAGSSPQAVIDTVRRLTHYSPCIVPFSFNSPLVGGALWEGLSYRTYRRTGPRPAALAHLLAGPAHPMAKKADPSSQHLRVEFKAFDMVGDDRLLAELFHLVLGIALADERDLPGRADFPDAELHRKVAFCGFAEPAFHAEATRVVAAARQSLRNHGYDEQFPVLEETLATRRSPAHGLREAYLRTSALFEPL